MLTPADLPSPEDVRQLLRTTLTRLVEGDPRLHAEAGHPPPEVRAELDRLLAKRQTYRDGALALLAWAVQLGKPIDFTAQLIPGMRHTRDPKQGVSNWMTDTLLPELKIASRRDPFQTLAKGAASYDNLTDPNWNTLVRWASAQDDVAPVRAAWLYLAAQIAATARDIPRMPALDTASLTFAEVVALTEELLATPSGGAHEQFLFATFLAAYVEQLAPVASGSRVSTKAVNASDSSASAAADVQLLVGGAVEEAYEVTAGAWEDKVGPGLELVRRHELRRVHVLVSGGVPSGEAIRAELDGRGAERFDLSVLDVGDEVRSLVARLRKPGRRVALELLYQHLRDLQPRDQLVRGYVAALVVRGLVEPA